LSLESSTRVSSPPPAFMTVSFLGTARPARHLTLLLFLLPLTKKSASRRASFFFGLLPRESQLSRPVPRPLIPCLSLLSILSSSRHRPDFPFPLLPPPLPMLLSPPIPFPQPTFQSFSKKEMYLFLANLCWHLTLFPPHRIDQKA